MTTLLMILSLIGLRADLMHANSTNHSILRQKAGIQTEMIASGTGTCTWPRQCRTPRTETVAQVQPCTWPRQCRKQRTVVIASSVGPCVWPKVCRADSESIVL